MKFEVYCDENHQDILTAEKHDGVKFMTIGSLWIPSELREEIKEKIKHTRECYKKYGEIKWSKVSPSGLDFYKALVDLFMSYGQEVRFRCIAVEADEVDWKFHDGDKELGFYKFYYQMLHHWIFDFNEYTIFCDYKTNRRKNELHELKACLANANLSSEIIQVQALSSKNVVLIQFADLLLGMASARINGSVREGGAKDTLIKHLEKRLDKPALTPTSKSEQKFNIFKIDLQGGW